MNKSAEETVVELDGEMSMEAKLIGKIITQQVSQYKKKIKTGERWKRWSVGRIKKKKERGMVVLPPKTNKNLRQPQQRLRSPKHKNNLRLN